jgi:two-component system chemotaxis response regulator CheB
VGKPSEIFPKDRKEFFADLATKVKTAARANVKAAPVAGKTRTMGGNFVGGGKKVIAVGASTGGTEAIFSLLKMLPPALPGIVIVQHIPPGFSKMFAQRLDKQTPFQVKEAEDGDFLSPGHVFLAPGDRHMTLRKMGQNLKIECFEGEKVSGHRPSVDVLFDSVARAAGGSSVGIILTGMGRDGARGLLAMREAGARTSGRTKGRRSYTASRNPLMIWGLSSSRRPVI